MRYYPVNTGQLQGEAHANAKLTEAVVRELRRLHEEVGVCKRCAAMLNGVNYQTAWDALSYNTWRHVK